MSRELELARFKEPGEPMRVGMCMYCDGDIYVGDEIARSYDRETVHADCWNDFSREVYLEEIGVVGDDGDIY